MRLLRRIRIWPDHIVVLVDDVPIRRWFERLTAVRPQAGSPPLPPLARRPQVLAAPPQTAVLNHPNHQPLLGRTHPSFDLLRASCDQGTTEIAATYPWTRLIPGFDYWMLTQSSMT